MNEAISSMSVTAHDDGQSGEQKSAGAMLRRAREAAGLHIGALAVTLKVPVKKLEALEADRLDLLPDAVFARALAGTVCRMLKIDPAPVLAAFPQTKAQKDLAQRMSSQPTFRPSGHSSQKSLMERLSRPFMLLGFAFAIGALVLMFFPAIQQLIDEVKRGIDVSNPSASRSSASQAPPAVNLPIKAATSTESASGPDPVAAATAMSPSPLPNASSASGVAASEPALASVQPAVATSDVLMLTARGNSWVEVMDASRVVVLRKTMLLGESQTVGGALPMTVVLGRANMLDVQVRGKVVDLAPLTKDNVARFEVK